jgi:hypothetical protein
MTSKSKVVTNIFDEIEVDDDQEIIDIWGSKYVPIQWQNILRQWEAPLEHWGGSMLEFEHDIVPVRHQNHDVPGFLLDSISIAPFAVKIHWGYKDADGKYITANEPDWSVSDAWRSRVHILALMKEADDTTPIIITAGSNTGKHLLANIRQGQRRVKNMLKKIGRPNIPTHLFWMEMIAGPPIIVGEDETSQTIWPPISAAPANVRKMTIKVIAKHLTDLYVGHDIKSLFDEGLFDEGQEWSIRQPEQLVLSDGNGSDNVALPPASVEAVVLVDGSLHIPDLSNASIREMKNCAMTIPALFNHQSHADRAFSKMLREKHINERAGNALMWEAWKLELLERWDALQALEESQNRETDEWIAERSATDEVEAHEEGMLPPPSWGAS